MFALHGIAGSDDSSDDVLISLVAQQQQQQQQQQKRRKNPPPVVSPFERSSTVDDDVTHPVDLRRRHRHDVIADEDASVERKSQFSLSDDLMLVEEHIRPLIKEELRYSIRTKRIAKGLPVIVDAQFKEEVRDVRVVSPETRKKRERRRERNKIAAAKCRFKKKLLSEHLQEESSRFERMNSRLRREVLELQGEKQRLVCILDRHSCCRASGDVTLATSGALSSVADDPAITVDDETRVDEESAATSDNGDRSFCFDDIDGACDVMLPAFT